MRRSIATRSIGIPKAVACLWLSVVFSVTAIAQLEVPVRLEFIGATDTSAQMTGLADPLTLDAAISLGSLRHEAATTTTVQGSAELQGVLVPAPQSYTTGLFITILPSVANGAGATLELNGLGARPIVKQGGIPLDSADLSAGIPARLLFDGTRFQLIGSSSLPCPFGSYPVSRTFCVDSLSRSAATFFEANTACMADGKRLCTFSEWSQACRSSSGFLSTVISAEWVDHAANNTNGGKLVGAGSDGENDVPGTNCEYGGQAPAQNPFRYRCCAHR